MTFVLAHAVTVLTYCDRWLRGVSAFFSEDPDPGVASLFLTVAGRA